MSRASELLHEEPRKVTVFVTIRKINFCHLLTDHLRLPGLTFLFQSGSARAKFSTKITISAASFCVGPVGSEGGRESGQPIRHRRDENRFDVMIEAGQDQGTDQGERRAER